MFLRLGKHLCSRTATNMSLTTESVRWLIVFILLSICVRNTAEDGDECWSNSTLYKISSVNDNGTDSEHVYSEVTLVNECHLSFIREITNKTCAESTSRATDQYPPNTQKYGYGFLAVAIISVLSLAGFVAFPLMNKPYYKYINAFFTALAVGTLFADSVFQLLPIIFSFNPHRSHRHEHGRTTSETVTKGPRVPLFLWQMVIAVLTAYVFYVVELFLRVFIHHRHKNTEHSYDLNHHDLPPSIKSVLPLDVTTKASNGDKISSPHALSHSATTHDQDRHMKTTGWMIIIGDGIHNVADGLAIGAAFAEDTLLGVTTSIAIACHELPTELGEYMVLIESGFTRRKALVFNFISACTAMLGFFIGVSVAQDEMVRTWIFAITFGTFSYIALVDLWPTLMPETEIFDWIRFACVTFGYLLGILILFILTTFEDRIVSASSEIKISG